jgi:Na+-transporting NADH:ubiquinone oxidoreductase subunit NqrC
VNALAQKVTIWIRQRYELLWALGLLLSFVASGMAYAVKSIHERETIVDHQRDIGELRHEVLNELKTVKESVQTTESRVWDLWRRETRCRK